MEENHVLPELRHGRGSVVADFAGDRVQLLVLVFEHVVVVADVVADVVAVLRVFVVDVRIQSIMDLKYRIQPMYKYESKGPIN